MEMIKIKNSNILHEAVKEERKAGTLTRGASYSPSLFRLLRV